ncbi:SHOCT domain-containing protein [Streptomyces sp. NBC_00344]|uniref:SHOCT domain-containing protein n=1 Tax=Streptomyces sp. NBC_00344 TaxID=2975720 RepID=UPI002E1DEA90
MDDYPLLDLFLTMLYFFLWVMWFFLLFKVITDLFRDHSLSGWAKAGWLVFVLLVPYVGVLVYLIARGRSMRERDVEQARDQEQAFRSYVQKAAGGPGPGHGGGGGGGAHASELAKLADLKRNGDLTADEYERAKAKILA